MSKDVMNDIIQHIITDKQYHAKLVELYFLICDPEVGDLTWKIAGLPPQKRELVRQLVECLDDSHPYSLASAAPG